MNEGRVAKSEPAGIPTRLVQQDRIEAGIGFDWDLLPPYQTSLFGLPEDAEELRFRRERKSHRGIRRFRSLRRLWLHSVNQEFLEEVSELPAVEMLLIDRLTATDLRPLRSLRRLRRLIIEGGTKINDLDWVAELPPVEALAIENFKRVSELEPLASLTGLSALGVEGSTWTMMRVASLAPLARLKRLRRLFLTSLRVTDRSLQPLYALTDLEVLQCAAAFSDDEFIRLRRALPRLRCDWFDVIDRYGSIEESFRVQFGSATKKGECPDDDRST